MNIKKRNIFHSLPKASKREIFTSLLTGHYVKIERIVSKGQSTKPGKWLTQSRGEWVLLLQGTAALKFRQDRTLIHLKTGDYLWIPARQAHRVEKTSVKPQAVWLAVHIRNH